MIDKKTKLCELRKDGPAVVFCSECRKCYCNECSKFVHGAQDTKWHNIEVIQKDLNINTMCPIHKNNPLNMFYVDRVELCCTECRDKISCSKFYGWPRVVNIPDVNKDNMLFSASSVRMSFANTLKIGIELEKRIETKIDDNRKKSNEIKARIEHTFKELHEKLTKEEAEIKEQLERECNASEETLNKVLNELKKKCEFGTVLNEAYSKNEGKRSRFMELSIVSEMEKQRKEIEKIQTTVLTENYIKWNSVGKKLTFAKSLFNGAPTPSKVSFSNVLNGSLSVSWDCDESLIKYEDKGNLKYVVEMKKTYTRENDWKCVYSGIIKTCFVKGLEKDTEYCFRVRCIIGDLQGGWNDIKTIRTKNDIDSAILSQEWNKKEYLNKLCGWCKTSDFKLLYRGTKDGFKADDFHRKCDNQGKTLILVKNERGHIFGGYASIPWESPEKGLYKRASGSFLFTLSNMYGIEPTLFPLKNEIDVHAVGHSNKFGPIFGEKYDLFISSNCNMNMSSYANLSTYNNTTEKGNSIFSSNPDDNHFQVQEIEVFIII